MRNIRVIMDFDMDFFTKSLGKIPKAPMGAITAVFSTEMNLAAFLEKFSG